MILEAILFTSIVLISAAFYGLISRDNPIKLLVASQLLVAGGVGILAALLASSESPIFVQSGQTLAVLLVATDLTTEAMLLASLLTVVRKLGVRRLNELSSLRG